MQRQRYRDLSVSRRKVTRAAAVGGPGLIGRGGRSGSAAESQVAVPSTVRRTAQPCSKGATHGPLQGQAEAGHGSVETRLWFDRAKYTGQDWN